MAKWGEINCPRCAELEEQIAAMEEGLTAVHMAGYMDGRKAAEAKLAKAVEALERVMVGGNHLAIWLPDNHPTSEAEPLAALEQIGAGVSYDVWCCWRSIMLARTTLAELKGQDDE